jgi:hypothetical protein
MLSKQNATKQSHSKIGNNCSEEEDSHGANSVYTDTGVRITIDIDSRLSS